jgi:hypothetical protein
MARRKHVDLISADEKGEAIAKARELIGFAVDNTERRLFLKCAFRTGDISTVWIDPALVGDLFWHLKALLRDRPKSDGPPAKLEVDTGAKTYGYQI